MKFSTYGKAMGFLVFTIATLHGADITVDYAIRHQTLRGIGTSTRTEDAYLKQSSIQDYYLNDFGASAFRTWLPYTTLSSYTDLNNIKYQNFNVNAAEGSLRIAIDLKKKKPSLMLIGTFWTPPGWMKVSGNDNGTDGANSSVNVLREDREVHYAKFILETAKMMRDKYGAPLDAISINNEPRFDTFYGSCVYSDAQYARLFRKVVDAFRADNYDMKFFGTEHMTFDVTTNLNMLREIVEDPAYTDAMPYVAAHGYTNGVATDTKPTSASTYWTSITDIYNKEYWMTETSGEPHTWDGALNGVASAMHNAFVGGRASLYTYWLFNHESPYHGEELFEKAVPQKKAYAFQHYSKYVRPGMVRLDATPSTLQKFDISSWADVDAGVVVMVALNRNDTAKTVTVKMLHNVGVQTFSAWRTSASDAENFLKVGNVAVSDEGEFTLTLPPLSIVTLRGTGASFDIPQYTVVPANSVVVPATATTYKFKVSGTRQDTLWKARSKIYWAKVTAGAENTGDAEVSILMQRNASAVDRTHTLEIAGQNITITQLAKAPETLLKSTATANFDWGYKWNSLFSFAYDVYYPFVFVYSTGEWVYIYPEGTPAPTEDAGYFFFRFGEGHWGWTQSALYPTYVPFGENGMGELREF
ncbi:MAG: glycoside hydrolase family 30 beta sandwich domain-containing protein [Verrucomicrobiota bacterium]|nr:glycoside hydrolase family 30 beta sandwich domain-containing protein [Verrucomicrobiota bacterium]